MNKKSYLLRAAASAFTAVVLTAAGAAVASAADEPEQDVEVNVEVTELAEPGVLALSVASPSTTLTENGSTELVRQFTGELPLVTVTDTRTGDEIPDGAFWAVVGTASDFVHQTDPGAPAITAGHLGWEPALVQGDGEAFISVGDEVETVLDGDRGLVDQELLFLGDSVPAVDAGGIWTANANLFLRVNSTVTPGAYKSMLTLSLFE